MLPSPTGLRLFEVIGLSRTALEAQGGEASGMQLPSSLCLHGNLQGLCSRVP